MIKESKYILRRILIGVGIILVLSFIRGYKVKALTSFEMYNGQVAPTFPTYCDNKKTLLYTSTFFSNLQPPNFIFDYKHEQSRSFVLLCIDTDNLDFVYGTDKFNQYSISFANFKRFYYQNQRWNEFTNSQFIAGPTNGVSYSLNSTTTCPFKDTLGCLIWYNDNYFITNGTIMYTDFDIVKEGNKLYFDRATAPIFKSSIESLQPTKITNNNVITGYIFRPKFTNFNTDSYVYQYKVGKDSTRWLSLTENEQQIKINNNIELYVRIKDLSNNDVVDSQTFTITDIGTFATNQDYDISFSGEYRTMNYLNNTICVSSSNESVIKEYQIYVDYLPKASILKYQYQYVNDGDSLDSNNWSNVSSLDNGSITYVASQNGTLYARILDSSDNVLYNSTFTVDSIGKLGIDSKDNCVKNFFTKISSNINYGGPVSSLFVIPVNTLNTLYSSMSNSSSCSPIQLGSLLGTNIQFGCYNFKSIVGNEVYNIIDIIFAFVLTIGVFKFILKLYNNFISMKEV